MQAEAGENTSQIAAVRFCRAGFTLIELMVVVSIMLIMVTIVTVNFNGLRADRNLGIAQNELVTNLRKAQSYTLSGHLVGGQPAQYYIMKFNGSSGSANQYSLQAIYNASPNPSAAILSSSFETYQLPPGIVVSSTPMTIVSSLKTQTGPCGLVAFKSPFATILFNGQYGNNSGCDFSNFNNDDYSNVLNFVVNSANNTTSSDAYAVVHLVDSASGKKRDVLIRGVTGIICPTTDGVSCSN